jgi:hypothetical protein
MYECRGKNSPFCSPLLSSLPSRNKRRSVQQCLQHLSRSATQAGHMRPQSHESCPASPAAFFARYLSPTKARAAWQRPVIERPRALLSPDHHVPACRPSVVLCGCTAQPGAVCCLAVLMLAASASRCRSRPRSLYQTRVGQTPG